MAKIKIAPSLVSAPSGNLSNVIELLEKSGADYIHFDIEDGCFVPVMNLGTKIISDLRPLTNLPFDVHLMMVNPEWVLPQLARYGVNRISIHYEASQYPRRILRKINSFGIKAGIAINPKTPLPELSYLFPYLSFVVILTTEPEEPDSPFLPDVLQKLVWGIKKYESQKLEWVIDGGVNLKNIEQIIKSGANTLVIGRSVFHNNDIRHNLELFKEVCMRFEN